MLVSSLKPREKLLKYGPQNLTTSELIALIIRTGKKNKNYLQLSQDLLAKFPLDRLTFKIFSDLAKFDGIGITKACSIMAGIELGLRIQTDTSVTTRAILNPNDLKGLVEDFRESKKEQIWAFYLNARHTLLHKELVFMGSLDNVQLDPRALFEPAIIHSALYIILVHNHPSGEVAPSASDLVNTARLIKAGRLLSINIVDHVIVSKSGLFSFKEHGMLSKSMVKS